jgi:hypothetical protein
VIDLDLLEALFNSDSATWMTARWVKADLAKSMNGSRGKSDIIFKLMKLGFSSTTTSRTSDLCFLQLKDHLEVR